MALSGDFLVLAEFLCWLISGILDLDVVIDAVFLPYPVCGMVDGCSLLVAVPISQGCKITPCRM